MNRNELGSNQVPAQKIGSEMNAVEQVQLNSEMEAIDFFQVVKQRLLDVNRWGEIAGAGLSEFYLTDGKGDLVQRKAITGDHIRIDIPGPGGKIGGGYDWVVIEEIKSDHSADGEVLSMTARPCSNPLTPAEDTAHFLSEAATSTFQVKRIGRTISAEEHGRNELPNTHTDSTFDNIRNTFVGWGAKIGFSYPQWKALVMGLLDHKPLD